MREAPREKTERRGPALPRAQEQPARVEGTAREGETRRQESKGGALGVRQSYLDPLLYGKARVGPSKGGFMRHRGHSCGSLKRDEGALLYARVRRENFVFRPGNSVGKPAGFSILRPSLNALRTYIVKGDGSRPVAKRRKPSEYSYRRHRELVEVGGRGVGGSSCPGDRYYNGRRLGK